MLGIFLSFVTTVMTLNVMMDHGDVRAFGVKLSNAFPWLFSPASGQIIRKYIQGTHPDIAWGVLLAAGVFFYLSLAPSSKWAFTATGCMVDLHVTQTDRFYAGGRSPPKKGN